MADEFLLTGQAQSPVLHAQRQDHAAAFIAAAFLGFHQKTVFQLFHTDDLFQLHIGTQIHGLIRELFGKFRAGNFDGAGNILHLGGEGDLAAEAVLFNDQDALARPEGIDRGSQSAGTAADNDNVMHNGISFHFAAERRQAFPRGEGGFFIVHTRMMKKTDEGWRAV